MIVKSVKLEVAEGDMQNEDVVDPLLAEEECPINSEENKESL